MLLQNGSVNFGDRLQTSFSQVFGDLVPALLGALVILFAGYLLAKVLEKLTERFLRRIRLNRMLERGGVMQAVERSGSHLNPIRVLANLVFWLVMFAVILVAANALGLQSLANVFSELVSYIPSVIAAIVIILVGIVLGGFVGGLIGASAGALHGGGAVGAGGRGGARGPRRGDPPRHLHGAAGARHRDRHRDDGVRDPVRRDRAGDGAGVRARQPRAGGRGDARVVRGISGRA